MSNATPRASRKKIRLAPRVVSWALLAIATIATVWALAVNQTEPAEPIVVANGQMLTVEVADTEAERTRGLSGRDSLPKHQGMLFAFKEEGERCFWMKDMRFAIDMVWLDDAGVVVHIEERIAPETYPAAFCPSDNARYVLEVNAGVVDQLRLQEGTDISVRLTP